MTNLRDTGPERSITLTLLAAALSMAVIGLLTLAGWALDVPILANWKTGTQLMAPVTAVLALLFAAALALSVRIPPRNPGLVMLFCWMGAMTALLLFALRLLDVYTKAELLGLSLPGVVANTSFGHVSPITAFCFLLANGALLASLSHVSREFYRGWPAWGTGGLVSMTGYLSLLAHAFGTSLLSGKWQFYPALNTGLVILIMGLALLALAARYAGRMAAPVAAGNLSPLPYLLTFAALAAGTLVLTHYYARDTEQRFRQVAESQLMAVSELKTQELARWRMERFGDAALSQNALFTAAVRRLLETPDSAPAQWEVQDWLRKFHQSLGYDRAFLLDAQGVTLTSASGAAEPASGMLAERARVALRSGRIMLQDFYRDERDQRVYLALLTPILDPEDSNRPLGVVVLRIDPSIYLYPLIKRWPAPSDSAETLLVRRDGNDALFLNDLRFQPDAALNLRMSLAGHTQMPAVKAVLGQRGIVEGIDYRGVPVLAALRAVPDLPWLLVTRMDLTEIYAPLRTRMLQNMLLICAMLGLGGIIMLFIWRQQKFAFFRRQHEMAALLWESEEWCRTILHTVMDGFWLTDTQGRLLEVNKTYCRMSGYSEQELLSMHAFDLESPEPGKGINTHLQTIMTQGEDRFESRHRRKDGCIFAVEVSAQYRAIKGGRLVFFLRDISERKQSEEKLHLAASVFSHVREGIMITADDGTIIDINDAFSDIFGYSRDEVLGQNPRFLKSGRHKHDFYAAMWRSLLKQGGWSGEIWNLHKNGEVCPEMLTISPVPDAGGGALQYIALFSDISLLKEHEFKLERSAHYDALTSLPNRVLLADRLHQGMVQTRRRRQQLAVVFLDLDGFKDVNDKHGHEAGDQLLITVSARMKQVLRESDTLARIGGDEFVAVLIDCDGIDACIPLLTRMLAAAAQPVQYGSVSLQVSASVGVTFYRQAEDIDAEQLLRQADQAMYQAKLTGKNRYHFFDAEQDMKIRSHHESLERIRRALTAREFVLYYQPKVNMRTGRVIGAEALIRWQHPERGLLQPDAFLPLIDNHSLAVELGEWVINTALTQMEFWQAAGLTIPVSVNICARQLQQASFVERLQAQLTAHPHVRPGDLELEMLETSAMEDLTKVSRMIDAGRKIGVSFALDDFGTGYSSLTYLKRLPVNQLKIDQSFVRDMINDPDDRAIVEGVIGLATAFRHQVIAEGVETFEQGKMLLQLGCDLAQGYAIARPMPALELPGWSAAWQPDPAWTEQPSVSHGALPMSSTASGS